MGESVWLTHEGELVRQAAGAVLSIRGSRDRRGFKNRGGHALGTSVSRFPTPNFDEEGIINAPRHALVVHMK